MYLCVCVSVFVFASTRSIRRATAGCWSDSLATNMVTNSYKPLVLNQGVGFRA